MKFEYEEVNVESDEDVDYDFEGGLILPEPEVEFGTYAYYSRKFKNDNRKLIENYLTNQLSELIDQDNEQDRNETITHIKHLFKFYQNQRDKYEKFIEKL